jgi:hypothetical protein
MAVGGPVIRAIRGHRRMYWVLLILASRRFARWRGMTGIRGR